MKDLNIYLGKLSETASKHLDGEYSLSSFNIPSFEKINFYLLDRALNGNKNLFIKSNITKNTSLIYVPTVISTAFSLFFKNFCDDDTSYKLGEVLQKDSETFKVVNKSDDTYSLLNLSKKGDSIKRVSVDSIKKYIVTDRKLSNRKVKTNFKDYKQLFRSVFKVNYVPSKFKYKAAIILEKKELLSELKNQNYTKLDLLKAIPLQWVTKKGNEDNKYIPIEPMIYLVPDYETFKEYIFDKGYSIETVIFIGKNKYDLDTFKRLNRDLREENIPNAIITGDEEIDDQSNRFLKWNWTYPEMACLSGKQIHKTNSLLCSSDEYIESLDTYYNYLLELEEKYSIRLYFLKKFQKHLYSLVLPSNKNSRLINQVDYLKHWMIKETKALITDELENQNENPESVIIKAESIIESIFNNFNNSKLKYIKDHELDFLVVPDDKVDIWKKEYKNRVNISNYKDFFQKPPKRLSKVGFISLFGYVGSPQELIYNISNSEHIYIIFCYPEEHKLLIHLFSQYEIGLIAEYTSKDRQELTGLKFDFSKKPLEISDRIQELAGSINSDAKIYDHSLAEQVNYLMKFENKESAIYDGSKSALLLSEGKERMERIANLRPNDKIRIYLNVSKDRLYQIAEEEDKQGQFREIQEKSVLWKHSLAEYFEKQQEQILFYNENNLLEDLCSYEGTIKTISTLKKWLDPKDKEKFPSSQRNLYAIRDMVNCSVLNDQFKRILECRKIYRSIMIAMGRDLSVEVMDYITSNQKNKGKILERFEDEEIKSFINKAAPIRTIKSIEITEDDEDE